MSDDPRRAAIIAAARSKLGIPYALPPAPPVTTDCSYWFGDVYANAGLPVPNWLHPTRTAEQIRAALVPVSFADVLPGDALFFERTYDITEASAVGDGHVASHIGISLGAGTKRMLNAVEPVSAETNIGTAYWQAHIFEARRHPALVATTSPGGPVTVPTRPRGIDVSSNNGAIDWPAVAASGVQFAICKATGGTWYRNPRFVSDWLAMQAAGLVRGAYHYAFESSGQAFPGDGPEAEADYFLAEVARGGGLQTGDLLALDIEEGSGNLGGWALAFVRRVESRVGFKPLVYTSAGFATSHGFAGQPALGEAGLWLAAWSTTQPDPPDPWDLAAIWQHSNDGRVPGISGPVDLNQFNGDISRLPLYGKPASAPAPAPSFSVGPGLLAAMAAHGDSPASPEVYVKDGSRDAWSEAFGSSGARYVYLPATGAVHRYDPAA